MMKITKAEAGELLYLHPQELTILVVLAGDDGIRYIDPMNLEFDNNGCIRTNYISYSALSEWSISLGTVASFAQRLKMSNSY